ncbi:M23 family metallopeptidase [Streptomyces sp. NPDC058157]|uniref:M23 family metallopeptidase n=1 Tax=Streptomyces sp. NPDC058157 TaxID=3346360 RepID=UPI0036EB8D00
MNDRPTSGQYPETGYDGLSTTTFAGDQAYVSYETQGQGYQYVTDYASSGSYAGYDAYGAYAPSSADTGAYDTTAWTAQQDYLSSVPAQTVPEDATGSWDASAWDSANSAAATADYASAPLGYDTSGSEQTGQWDFSGYGNGHGNAHDTGAYAATAWNSAGGGETGEPVADVYADDETSVFEPLGPAFPVADDEPQFGDEVHDLPTQMVPLASDVPVAEPRSARRAGGRGAAKGGGKEKAGSARRRTPAKRSALLTVAVPSVCVMGVAGVAAASVSGLTGGDEPSQDTTTMAAPDPSSVKPVAANNKLDTQLTALSADAGDFADRASRTQERIDLKQRQEDEKKKRAEEAAAKEAARPKFAIPVTQHGLSAMFGQAGGMWMSVHTGIDFPVSYGTPVMAATDGTMRTQWNSAYGNMAILTSPDGTETWYCHLSSTKIRSGQVKAGDVIAYSGNSGNSTGPHLHFEVRPGGGSAIDPLAWLRSHDLDPT